MYNFSYFRPLQLTEATRKLSEIEGAKLLSGGMTLLPTMKQRLCSPSALIDINTIDGLDAIEICGDGIAIGARARHFEVASSPIVRNRLPALAELAGLIGDPAVRHRGTIGGSIANNDPAADYPAGTTALDATIVTNKRSIGVDEFFVDLFETALEVDEIVVQVRFPHWQKTAWQKFRSPASRFAVVGVFVACTGPAVRVAVTGAGTNGVFRAAAFEQALAADFQPNAIADIDIDQSQLIADGNADQRYRAHLIKVLTQRAVASIQ
jgi:aerobic carbon-monoxide dehydrogenase medium subunit